MTDTVAAQKAVDSALDEAARLRRTLRSGPGPQVRSVEDRALAKATVFAWLNTHRPVVALVVDEAALAEVDARYTTVLGAADRLAARTTYDTTLKGLGKQLSLLRTKHLVAASTRGAHPTPLEPPPSFAILVADPAMQAALGRRWEECNACIRAAAPLAAIVMMGGLLETLLLARVNSVSSPATVFTAKAAPKDKAGKPLPLKDWMLRSYIDVAHELKWISQSAKDLGTVLRDYRNYIHPYKELSHGVALTIDDASLLWDVSRSIAKQLVR